MTEPTVAPETLEIVLYPDPFLNKRAREITAAEFEAGVADGWKLADLVERMKVTMYANEGVGLAAPQVRIGLRLFVADDSADKSGFFAVFNPRLEETAGSLHEEEGCLSIPDVRAKVKRSKTLVLRGQDATGKAIEKPASELLARVCQHETDHLDGVLFISRIGLTAKYHARRRLAELEEDFARASKTKDARKK